MIIKSMSRKAPTFGQLASYIARGSSAQSGLPFVRNLYASGRDQQTIIAQFLDNYRYLPERKGGNALYHEVIVLEPQPQLNADAVAAALHELAERYCEQRAPHQLAWGRVHHDTEFPHIHLMISANAVRSDRRVRMERAKFAQVQRDLEGWRAERLPEIRAQVIYGHDREKQTPTQPMQEGEMVRRTKSSSRKQQVFEQVKAALDVAATRVDFECQLKRNGLALYERGQTFGVTDRTTGKRYRLRTLGLASAYAALGRVRSQPESPQPVQVADSRVQELLRQRLQAAAREQLDGFERDDRERD